MTELLRVVRYDEQDQLVTLSDLDRADGTVYKARDTFTVTAGGRQPVLAAGENRRAGARQVAERRENGTVGATWMVQGATADAALARVEALLADADSARIDRYVLWRPEGASQPGLYPIRGVATAVALEYQAVRFAATRMVGVQVTWPVAPWAEEPRMDMGDDFRARDTGVTPLAQLQADYTLAVTPTSVAQGALELPASMTAAQARIAHLGRRPWQDGWVTVKGRAKTGAASVDFAVTPGVRYLATDSRYYFASLDAGSLRVREWDGAALLSRAAVAQAAPAAGTSYWLRVRAEGQAITAEYWTSIPTPHGTPAATVTYTSAATLRTGYPLLASNPMAAGAGNVPVLERWAVRPYSYRLLNTPAVVALPALPGTLPALADVDITAATTDPDHPRHVALGWRRRLAGREASGAAAVQRAMLIQGEDIAGSGGAGTPTVVADATLFRGPAGQATRFTLTNADADGFLDYRLDPTIFEPDDFADDVTVAVLVRYHRSSAAIVAPRLRAQLLSTLDPAIFQAAPRYTPEHGALGRYLPVQGTGLRTSSLGTLRLPVDQPEPVVIRLTLAWSAGTPAGATFAIDELYVPPLAALALGATGKDRDDGSYPPLLPAAGYTRRVRADLRGDLASWTGSSEGRRFSDPVGIGGAPIELPAGPEGVELLVRPSVAVPDDPVSLAADTLAHNATVHVAVTPRHHLVAA